MSRADRYTFNVKQEEYYRDFANNFDLNPITGILATVSNEYSVKQALKNLILTQKTEIPYNSNHGTRLNSMLFEPMEPITEEKIKTEILSAVNNIEPRVQIEKIEVQSQYDINAYAVRIFFSLINKTDNIFTLNLTLRRVR